MLLPYTRGREFPEEKAAGTPCRHLRPDARCGIHARLAESGWRGCVEYDCFGAGQLLTATTHAGPDRRDRTEGWGELGRAFAALRGVQELRFLLGDPACAESSYAVEAAALAAELATLARASVDRLGETDLGPWRERAGELFGGVAAERGGASHRGALLMAADLRGADLTDADLLGADLRDADLRGADLSGALFLTQPQLAAAVGDAATWLPARLSRPAHWDPAG